MRNSKLAIAILLTFLVQLAGAQATPPSASDVEQRVESILSKMTLEEKIDYIGGFNDFYVRGIPRLGLPAFKMSDGPIGLRNDGPATTMAGGIALAATWDTDLARQVGTVFGDDARARGVHFLLGPAVNIYRAPMAGRDFEYFGEDPFLAGQTALAYIEGVQSKGVCATVKHFMGNNQEYDRHNVDSIIDERTMREIYLPAFETAVKQGHVCAIMDSYNLTNGVHMSQNDYLNNQVAKKQWGFDGIIMSDWDSTYDGVAAANGGLDIEMPSGAHMNRATLLPAIKAGKVSEATINEHVRRILRRGVQYGWLDRDQIDRSIPTYNLRGREVALEEARSSMVLLKNDGDLLPLDKSTIKTLAVIGPDAYPGQPVGGGSAAVRPFNTVSYLEGLANYLGSGTAVNYSSGIPSLSEMADATDFVTHPSAGKPGLKAERFKAKDLTGSADLTTDTHVNFGFDWPWVHSLATEYRSARWTGYYIAKDAGTYDVFIQGPGEEANYRLFMDDKPVVDNWTRANAFVNYKTLNLTAGPHSIKLEFLRPWGDSNVRLGIVNTASVVKPDAVALAKNAQAVVLCVGFDSSSEGEGADRTFRLPPGQDELIRAMVNANKNVIVVMTSGGAVDMNPWIHRVPALFQSWYSGQEGGSALAQLLFGQVSPSGKLPASFERRFEDNAVYHSYYADPPESKKLKYTEGVFVGYRHFGRSPTKPQFPFGYGLSYTKFTYSNLAVMPASGSLDKPVTVSFDLTNGGSREGAEVAELYVGAPQSNVPRPVKELKGFTKLDLKPGETRHLTLTLDRRAFSYYDVNKKDWSADPGDYGILVGGSSDKIQLTGSFKLLP